MQIKIPKTRASLKGKYSERRRVCFELGLARCLTSNLNDCSWETKNYGMLTFLEEFFNSKKKSYSVGWISNVATFRAYANKRVDYFELCLKNGTDFIAIIGKLSKAKTTFQIDFFAINQNIQLDFLLTHLFVAFDSICLWSGGLVDTITTKQIDDSLMNILCTLSPEIVEPKSKIRFSIFKKKAIDFKNVHFIETHTSKLEREKMQTVDRLNYFTFKIL